MHYGAMIAGGLMMAALGAGAARADVLVTVDKSAQVMTVAVDGVTRWQWKVSTGRNGHDTPNGTFRALYLDAEHYSKKYDDAPMPHSIFFTDLGHAIHGTDAVRRLGMPASHGCVRLDPQNATRLFDLVAREGARKTTIVVTGSASDALARVRLPAAPTVAPAAQPSPGRAAAMARAATADNLFAPVRLAPASSPSSFRQIVAQNAAPPPAPPNYPPFPAPAATFGWR
jgi:hypothetical protein